MKTCMTLWAASVGEVDVYVLPFELVWYEGWGMGGERVLENKKIPGIKPNEYQNATVFRTHMYLPGLCCLFSAPPLTTLFASHRMNYNVTSYVPPIVLSIKNTGTVVCITNKCCLMSR